jgi:TolB-like protein/Flp pilus assembly protein TadD
MGAAAGDRRSGEFRLGEWLVRPSLNQLSRGSTVVHVRPKAMDVLVFLAARSGEVASRQEILDAIWAKKFLADTALSRVIFELRAALGDESQAATYIETVPKRGYRLIAPVTVAAGHAPLQPRRIVVLPFENLGVPDDNYFAAGITEEITARLASVEGLAVISPSTAIQYAGTGKTAREIGHELGVDYLLEGTVRWCPTATGGSRVRITPRLVLATDNTQVWAGAFDRVIEDIFTVQSEIASSVIDEVGVTLGESERSGFAERPTANVEAYQAYLQGLFYSDQVSFREQRLRTALSMLQNAVERDRGFGLAYAEVSRMRSALYHFGFDRSEENRKEAERAADRALELAPDAPRVHLSIGLHRYWCYRDYRGALQEFRIARKGLGRTAELLQAEGWTLRRMGCWDDALGRFFGARDLNPRGWGPLADAGETCWYMRRYEEAQHLLERAIALAPDESAIYEHLANVLCTWKGTTADARRVLEAMPRQGEPSPATRLFWQDVYEGRYQAALERASATSFAFVEGAEIWQPTELLEAYAFRFLERPKPARRAFERARRRAEQQLRERPDDSRVYGALAVSLAGVGCKAEAFEAARRSSDLVSLSKDAMGGWAPLLHLAQIHTMVGEYGRACARLDTLLSIPSPLSVPLVELDPTWAPLRSHPCYKALVAKHSR